MEGRREEQLWAKERAGDGGLGDGDGTCGKIQWAAVGAWSGALVPYPSPTASFLPNQPTCQPGGSRSWD